LYLICLCIAFWFQPQPLYSQSPFTLTPDLDSAEGDQGATSLEVSAGDVVSIQIFGDDIQGATAVSMLFQYDARQVFFDGFDVGGIMTNAVATPSEETHPTSIEITIWPFASRTTPRTGLLGTARFRTSASFSSTTIRLAEGEISLGRYREETASLDIDISLQDSTAAPSPGLDVHRADFDGDGMVALADFLEFASNFGSQQEDDSFDGRFDLDGDGTVGLGDFLEFAAQFGKELPPPTPLLDPAERDALVALYRSTGGDNWTERTNWLSDKHVSTWHGVVAFDGHVSVVSLGENKLTGEVPVELGNLSYLRRLYLQRNGLSGPIPLELANSTNNEALFLHRNALSGEIPAELGGLSKLRWLGLNANQLSGAIPTELGDLSELRWMNLDENELSGTIPAELGNLSNLKILWIWKNALNGEISPDLGRLTQLLWLDFSENELNGAIPAELGDMTNVNHLWLAKNKLSGEIPGALGNLRHLHRLDINENELNGPIPPALADIGTLEVLRLNENMLSGEIPSEFGALDELYWLDLEKNELNGAIPVALADMSSLQALLIGNNKLKGSIPSGLGNAPALAWLDLSSNELSGGIPDAVGNLSNLERLWINDNSELKGALPFSLTNLSEVEVFQYHGTGLCAPLDDAFQAWLEGIDRTTGENCEETTTPVETKPLAGLRVSNGGVEFLALSSAEQCITLIGISIGGSTYTTHSSKWQRKAGESWADIPATQRVGLCPYSTSETGEYRMVAEITIDGKRGTFASENTFTVN
jgi:Leucine-rich repeat (LRR) protein